MSNTKKRICAWMLTIFMIAGIFPVSVFASEMNGVSPGPFDSPEAMIETDSYLKNSNEDSEAPGAADDPADTWPDSDLAALEDTLSEAASAQSIIQDTVGELPSDESGVVENPAPQEEEDYFADSKADPAESETTVSEDTVPGSDAIQLTEENAGQSGETVLNKSDTESRPEEDAGEEPEYEELQLNRPYTLATYDPEQLFIYRLNIWEEQNIHFFAKGTNLIMNAFKESTQQYIFEEHVELLDGEDREVFFPADSYLVVLRPEDPAPGETVFCVMDNYAAEQFFNSEEDKTASDIYESMDNSESEEAEEKSESETAE